MTTAQAKVHITVTLANGSTSETPIDQTFFTSNGGFELFDVYDLCKNFLETYRLVWCTCTIEATAIYEGGSGGGGDFVEVPGWEEDLTNTATFKVFYESLATGRDVSALNTFFLTTSDKKVLYKNAKLGENVGYVYLRGNDDPQTLTATTIATCKLADGSTASVTATATINVGTAEIYTGTLQLSYASVLAALQAVNANVVDVLAFRIEMDSRIISYVVSEDDTQHIEFFRFINEYGYPETVAISGVIKTVNDISQNVTTSGHTRVKYDQTVEQSFQFQSAALPSFVEPSVLSLLIAKDVAVWFAGASKPVLITDSNWEPSNEIGTVNAVKLTWKLVDDRAVKPSESLVRIFNNIYDNTYG